MRRPSTRPYFWLGSVMLSVVMLAGNGSSQETPQLRLTLHDAIEKGLQANLSVLVADTRVQELEGTRTRRFATLLPRVRTQSYVNLQNRNLRAFGISFPAVPEVVGPFSNFDFRLYAEQNVLDLQTYHNWKASLRQLDASKLDYQDARDLIVRTIAGLYLNAQSAGARVEAAQARVTSAELLYRIAKDKHDVGTATGVDTLRAQVELANERQSLLVARNQQKQALLALARNIGLHPGTPLELAESLQYQPISRPEAEAALRSALLMRSDYMSLASQRLNLTEQQRATHARYYPRFSINGNYGGLGRSIGDLKGIGIIQGTLDFTLFDRDRKGEAQEIAARLRRIDDQIADLQRGIDQDIREALLNLESAAEQVAVAQEGRELAQRELDLAQDRFQSGVTNNVEVVTAQDELARAQENYIFAVSSHMDARFALSRAVGGAERNIGQYTVAP
jgi:outer membrane protein TolC